MHTISIIFIIILILFIQGVIFYNNFERIKDYKKSFSNSFNTLELSEFNNVLTINNQQTSNTLFNTILDNLNRYLSKNANRVSDYHLMKDIVERNCETKEEEINTQVPFPLYLGLMGTMLGILVGVGFLVLGGGIDNLLSLDSNIEGGINDLLSGVALAMITSISGILLTTIGAYMLKDAKSKVEQNKDCFLSWIQSELLPELATDISSAMAKMSTNLFRFNKTFADNTKDLQKTLFSVNVSYKEQTKLLEAIDKLNITQIASANIQVYEKLQNCTDEIDRLGQYLNNTNEYLDHVRVLNEKLGDADTRSQAIEKMAAFFEEEFQEINQRKAIISQIVGNVDDKLQKAMVDLQDSSEKKVQSVANAMTEQNERIKNILEEQYSIFHDKLLKMVVSADKQQKKLDFIWEEQRNLFQNKLKETTSLTEELKNLPDIKNSLDIISTQTKEQSLVISEQNKQLNELVLIISNLIENKIGHTISENNTPEFIYPSFKIPKGIRIIGIISFSIITIFCFFTLCVLIFLIFS